ncbi:MAG: methyl-accepting chemotaxis protein [Candidatus Pelagadaptatus aseana]|uniref:methyl-accepting chemotaxis protein n=1 Tax=Candidatus Pelagadaptatus aseana TaxID=3120508 RepID=UPI0039B1779B
MNRLSFGLKFGLVSAVFIIPMAVTNLMVINSYFQEFKKTSDELDAMASILDVTKLRRDLLDVHSLARINMDFVQPDREGGVKDRTDAKIQEAMANLNGLESTSDDADQIVGFNDKKASMQKAIEVVANDLMPISKFNNADLMMNEFKGFMKMVATQSGLAQDEDQGTRQITEFLLTSAFDASKVISDVRSIGSSALRKGGMIGSDHYGFLEDLITDLEKNAKSYEVATFEIQSQNPDLPEEILAQIEEAKKVFASTTLLIEDDFLYAEAMDKPWDDMYGKVTDIMAHNFVLVDQLEVFVTQQLEKRLESKRQQMMVTILGLILVFLIIFYLYAGFYVSTRETILGLSKVVDKVAAGDMTVSFQARSNDELGDLGNVVNAMVNKIHDLIQLVIDTVAEVESQSERVKSVSAESNQLVGSQRHQIELVSQAMTEMSNATLEVSSSSSTAVENAHSVNQETLNGREMVGQQVDNIRSLAEEIDESVSVINQLATDSAAISQVLDVIKGIAEQTNLLALNAAIEAARAGEQGRGFAVVADEVRTLAQRTQQSTEEIEQMIVKLQNGVDGTVKSMNASHAKVDETVGQSDQVQAALENILGEVTSIVDQSQHIATAAERQTAVANDIDQNIVEINRAGERTAEGASETEQASNQLSDSVSRLKDLIKAFKV